MSISERELRDLISVDSDLEKLSTISSDGKNLLTRIPKEIVERLGLKKGHKFRWLANNGKIRLEIVGKNAKEEN